MLFIIAHLVGIAILTACAAPIAATNITDANARLSRAPSGAPARAEYVGTYRSAVRDALGRRCRWLPSDSAYFEIRSQTCSSTASLVSTVGRGLNEFDTDALAPSIAVRTGETFHWIDMPPTCAPRVGATAPPSVSGKPEQIEEDRCVGCETVVGLIEATRYFDAHTLAVAHLAHFDNSSGAVQARLLLLSARAQVGLGDSEGADLYLRLARDAATAARPRRRIEFIRAWIHKDTVDEPSLEGWAGRHATTEERLAWQTYRSVLRSDPIPPQPKAAFAAEIERLAHDYHNRPRHRAWLAGLLNGLLPGAGYIYLGAWESAIQTLLLNSVFVGAAVELGWRQNVIPTIAMGVVASFFYFGGIAGAAQSAARLDAAAEARAREPLERRLFWQLSGW